MKRLARSVAESVDAPPALHPHLVALFKRMPSLGSSPRRVASLLQAHGVTRNSRVLDLACGKGSAALATAAAIGCRVHAVDGYEPFLADARRSARRRGLEHLVTFEHADLEQWGTKHLFDVAMMLGLWPLDIAARSLRTCVKRRGLYVLDDVFYDPTRGQVPRGLPRPPTVDRCHAAITKLGDTALHVHTFRPSEVAAINTRLFAGLQRNAAQLGGDQPQLRPALREYLARQEAANDVLSTSFRPALWVIRRGLNA